MTKRERPKSIIQEARAAEWLVTHGWWASDDGWRHGGLNKGRWPWPLSMAASLQLEVNKGGKSLVHEMMREGA